jgi:hypothetical protein
MTNPEIEPSIASEDRRKHLDYIQAVITRMSAASSAAKSWLLPVVTLAYGYALTNNSQEVALLGLLGVVQFGLLDVNYLRQEKAYRDLYNCVANRTREVPLFSLNPSDAHEPPTEEPNFTKRSMRLIGRWVPQPSFWLSWSIAPFYGGLILAGCAVLYGARC